MTETTVNFGMLDRIMKKYPLGCVRKVLDIIKDEQAMSSLIAEGREELEQMEQIVNYYRQALTVLEEIATKSREVYERERFIAKLIMGTETDEAGLATFYKEVADGDMALVRKYADGTALFDAYDYAKARMDRLEALRREFQILSASQRDHDQKKQRMDIAE